ncbi:MAG: CHAT domain-containing tetratricopeptide repeat protein [Vicinamibacteria bacterium]
MAAPIPACIVIALALAVGARADTLVPGEAVPLSLKTGETRRFTVEVPQGRFAAIDVEQAGADVHATVLPPDGVAILEADSLSGEWGPNPLAFVAPVGGTYAIELRARKAPPAGGALQVSLQAVREPTDADLLRAETAVVAARAARLVEDDDRRQESLPELRAALDGWQRLGDTRMEMWTALTLGNVLQGVFGENQQGAELLARPLAIARERQDEWAEARVSYNLAQMIRRMGRTAEARALFERAIALHRAAGRMRDLSNALRACSDLQRFAGDEEGALALAQESLETARQSGEPYMIDRAEVNVAQGYLRLSEHERVLEALDRPFPGLAQDRQARASISSMRASAYRMMGDDDRAYEAWLDALEEYEQVGNRAVVAEVWLRLSDVHRSRGEWDTALELIEPALEILAQTGDRLVSAGGRCRLGETELGRGEIEKARLAFAAAVELAGEGSSSARMCGTAGLAKAALAAGDLEGARTHAERAVAHAEEERASLSDTGNRAGALARTAPAFEVLTEIRMRQHALRPDAGHAAEALGVAEAGRARSLVELLADGRISAPAALGARPRPLDAARIQADVLDEGSLLLEFALGDEASYLWLVGPRELAAYRLPPRAEIETLARSVRDALGAPTSAAHARDAARRLGRLLLGPAADRLGEKRLLVVAPGVLQYLPFAALPDPRDPAGKPLVERHEIVQAPSASAVAFIRRTPHAPAAGPRSVAVLADPVYEASDPRLPAPARTGAGGTRARSGALGRLPFSRVEAAAIAKAAGPGRALQEIGFDASRARVLGDALAGHDIVHFATHGVLDSARPSRSGLVLSLFDRHGRPQDGALRLRDVYDLELSADLVVLSGCETALGRDLRGEGLVGLTGGFLHAGARQVVASLWRVDDLATSELMARFYRRLLRDGRTPPAALRAAQREMAADPRWRDPYYWAGFVVLGDWR